MYAPYSLIGKFSNANVMHLKLIYIHVTACHWPLAFCFIIFFFELCLSKRNLLFNREDCLFRNMSCEGAIVDSHL